MTVTRPDVDFAVVADGTAISATDIVTTNTSIEGTRLTLTAPDGSALQLTS